MHHYHGLIFDLGVSEGNDTAYYLQKGFRVIAVEADPEMFAKLKLRFHSEINEGSLELLNFAASDTCDESVLFYVHSAHQGVSGLQINKDLSPDGYKPPYKIETINWERLISFGAPYYVKVDLENNESKFLAGMAKSKPLPEFISVECHTLEPVEALFSMGYRRFKLINQNSPSGFVLPPKQYEGRQVDNPNFHHASGPFGLDVFRIGEWTDFDRFMNAWREAQVTRINTWFDCHAWEPSFASTVGKESILNSCKRWIARLALRKAQ